jgi:integrase
LKRRANGEGSCFQRKDGRWTAVTPHPTRKHFTRKTQIAALNARSDYLKKRRGNVSNASPKQTLAQYLDSWLASIEPSIQWSTYKQYSILVRKHIVPSIGSTPLRLVGPQHVQELIVGMASRPSNARHARRLLYQALETAAQWDLIPSNPVKKTKAPRVTKKSIAPLRPPEIKSFIALGDALGSFLLLTGVRMGEALALEWSDIDWESSRISIRQTLQPTKGGGMAVKSPKTKSSNRTNPVGKSVLSILKSHRKAQLEMRMAAGAKWQPWIGHDFVFTTPDGKPIGRQGAHAHVCRLFKAIGLTRRPHDLRHTFATELLRRGMPIKTVQSLLGHSSPNITLATYAHVSPEMLDDAANVMDVIASN